MTRLTRLLALLLVVAGCGRRPTSPPAAAPTETPDSGPVSAAEYGAAWPFTAPAGILRCHDGYSVVIEIDGTEYGLNGDARGRGKYAELDAALLIGFPNRTGTLPLIERGLKLCE